MENVVKLLKTSPEFHNYAKLGDLPLGERIGDLLYLAQRRVDVTFRVREIQPTPNPNAAKFILDRSISEQPTSFFNSGSAKDHPLAQRLFGIPGVSSLLFLGDFVTINKSPEARWADINPRVEQVLAEP